MEYLEENWTEREIQNFVRKTHEFLELLKEYPGLLQESKKKKYLHRGPINYSHLQGAAQEKSHSAGEHPTVQDETSELSDRIATSTTQGKGFLNISFIE